MPGTTNRLYSMKAMADLIGKIDPRNVETTAHKIKVRVWETGRGRVVNEAGKDKLLSYFAAERNHAQAS